jgi:serine protease AprX
MNFYKGWVLGWLFLGFACLTAGNASAQNKYWVLLKDKKGVSFDPYTYFDPKAIERRILCQLPLSGETDKPLNQTYLQQVTALADSVTGVSRWLNAIACFVPDTHLEKLRALPFVREIIPFSSARIIPATADQGNFNAELSPEDRVVLKNQVLSLGAATFKQKNLNGAGVRIAVLDVGFKTADTNPAFAHLRREKRILKTWDFVKNYENVYHHAAHGTEVLSCIAGRQDSMDLGLATGAEFLLARVERMHSEKFSEEENWLAAMEWADKNGADIINSSLGFTYDRYFREQMDGRTPMVARAANLAARKGMLVVNANGNDGEADWKIIGTPADADSVLSVGGISAGELFHVGFSSFGPTSDNRLKPNVVAFGEVVAAGTKGLKATMGTSFASPLVAGFAACAWQADRKLTNMQLFRKIEKAGHLFPYFDYAHGYGVPQAEFFLENRPRVAPTFSFVIEKNTLKVKLDPGLITSPANIVKPGMDLPVTTGSKPFMYYHLADRRNVLLQYYVLEVTEPEVFSIPLADVKPGTTLRVHYRGYTATYSF